MKWPFPPTTQPGKVEYLVYHMKLISQEDRLKVMEKFCKGCGTHELPCHCQNDE